MEKLEETMKEPNHKTHKFFFQISTARQLLTIVLWAWDHENMYAKDIESKSPDQL
ncbi:hypothetical protein J2TS6_52720 [Paenibacillus albilobatus]|uniref:Uncharacterized protein n=1 Tax=Paenibacillus albilobatus TaxID=2716884 RepID=A0A919XJL6_9BACL|nr:hypothetical protein J2TS6_52720 [Paenibacillus albilobatus]